MVILLLQMKNINITCINKSISYLFSCPVTFIEIFDVSVTSFVPLYHVTSGLGLAVQLHRSVISVPDSFGIIRGFSINDGANPELLSPPEIKMGFFYVNIFSLSNFIFKIQYMYVFLYLYMYIYIY